MPDKTYKAVICYPNIQDKSTLSGGSWTTQMPLSKLQSRVIKDPARTTNTLNASTKFTGAFDKNRTVKSIALVDHNWTVQSTWRFRMYDDAALTMLAYDSGILNTYEILYDELTVPGGWDGGNFWDLTFTDEERDGFYSVAAHILDSEVSAQYYTVEIFDELNPAGYLQIGRLFIGDGWTPATNMTYGASLQYESRDEIDEADSGTEYYNKRPSPRVVRFTYDFMQEDEAMGKAFDLQRTVGATGEVLFLWSQADTLHLVRRTFLGRMRTLSPIETDFVNNFRTQYEIKELL